MTFVISLSYPAAWPNMSAPTYGISNKLNNPDNAPFSPPLPWMIGNILSNVLINSIILSTLVIFPFNHVLFNNNSNLSLKIYQFVLYIPTAVTSNFFLSIFSKIVLADLHDTSCSKESPQNNTYTFFIFVTS